MRVQLTPKTCALLAGLAVALVVLLSPELAYAADDFTSMRQRGWLWAFLGAFGAGFVTSLTPCVYPMIPIVVGVFGARDQEATRTKAFVLATCYVLGMGVMYSGLGVVFALLGKQFGSLLANPYVVFPIVGLYLLLAASMFGAFELRLPYGLQQRLNRVGGRGYGGAFGLGLVGGLTAAPCTGPFLVGILGFVTETRNVPAGFSLMFTYAIGMGVLFWVLAAFAVALPKSGPWMEYVKSAGGIALIVAGIYFLRPVIPAIGRLTDVHVSFLLSSIAVAAVGIGIGAVHLSFHDVWRTRLRKGIGVTLAVVGLAGVINWVLTPKHPLPWRHDVEAALTEARDQGRPVMIDFSAEWCAPCKELEVRTFSDPTVYAEIEERFIPIKIDVTDGTDEQLALKDRFGAQTLPAVVLLGPDGTEVTRVDKYIGPDDFLDELRKVPR